MHRNFVMATQYSRLPSQTSSNSDHRLHTLEAIEHKEVGQGSVKSLSSFNGSVKGSENGMMQHAGFEAPKRDVMRRCEEKDSDTFSNHSGKSHHSAASYASKASHASRASHATRASARFPPGDGLTSRHPSRPSSVLSGGSRRSVNTAHSANTHAASKASKKKGMFATLDKFEECDSEDEDDSDGRSDDEATLEAAAIAAQLARLELLEKAKKSIRRAPAPGQLVESVTSRWCHFTEKMVVQLIEQNADVHAELKEPWDRSFGDYTQTIGATTLHFAARRGLLEVVNSMVDHGANVNETTDLGVTPIMVGVMFNQVQVVKTLFSKKGSLLQKDHNGLCSIDLAILEGRADMISLVTKLEAVEDSARYERVEKEANKMFEDNEELIDFDSDEHEQDDSPKETKGKKKLSQRGSGGTSDDGPSRNKFASTSSNGMRSGHLLPANLRNRPDMASATKPTSPEQSSKRRGKEAYKTRDKDEAQQPTQPTQPKPKYGRRPSAAGHTKYNTAETAGVGRTISGDASHKISEALAGRTASDDSAAPVVPTEPLSPTKLP